MVCKKMTGRDIWKSLKSRIAAKVTTARRIKALAAVDNVQSAYSLDAYASLLPRPGSRRVAILADQSVIESKLSTLQATLCADETYIILTTTQAPLFTKVKNVKWLSAANRQELGQRLKQIGPVDLLVSLLHTDATETEELFRELFFHVAPKGVFLIDRKALHRSSSHPRDLSSSPIWGRLTDIQTKPVLNHTSSRANILDAEVIKSTKRVIIDDDIILVQKRLRHYLKLRHDMTNELLSTRKTSINCSVLQSLPAGTFESKGTVASHHSSAPIRGLADRISYPQLHLRHYQGHLSMASNCLVFSRSEILADSFRHYDAKTLRHGRLNDITDDFARIPRALQPREALEGSYYHLDSHYSGHFGHLATEVLSRLWGWDKAKETIPELKAIFRVPDKTKRWPQLELELFGAYGIDPSDIVWVDKPLRLNSLVAATPMWHNQFPHSVHPELVPVWERLRSSLLTSAEPGPERIFVSRGAHAANRKCHNIDAVEDLFAKHGFSVVYPELLPLSKQASIFAAARIIAGFGGSALFNLLFAINVSTLIVLNQEAYNARNEHLFASLLGCDSHYFWSTPFHPHPVGQWRRASFFSDWEFDFDRNAKSLEKLLSSLES